MAFFFFVRLELPMDFGILFLVGFFSFRIDENLQSCSIGEANLEITLSLIYIEYWNHPRVVETKIQNNLQFDVILPTPSSF